MENVLHTNFSNEQEMLGDGDNLGQHEKDPYDNFMKRHLQHYGYYTGRNASYRENFQSLQDWRKNYDARLSGHHDLSLVEEQLGRSAQFPPKIFDNPSVFSTDGQLPDELLHRTTQLVFQYQAGRKIPKLREPRNLYALTKEAGPQQATRWPSHMQVVCPAIRFIDYTPSVPDPLYEPTGKEITPGVRGPNSGEMIYYNEPGRDLYFMRSRVAGCRLAMRSTTLTPREYPEDNLTLEFESRFESGNLLKVDKITDFDYELTLRTDLYTNKHTQWFFFRVRNMRAERNYRFTIINLMKPSSLYNQGMRPVWYSDMNAKKNKIGWTRFGTNIRYYRNNLCGRDGRSYYSLTWTCQFPYKDDCCYFAHCFPYTYSDLQEYLLQLANDPVRSRFCKQRVLTRTLAGNLVYILTITSPSRNPEISRAKRAVVITARVHPGETNASWMMKGFLDYLTGSTADAKLLRDSFIFKIVPMLNPDGVIVGNYRCSLAGRDLNRNYKSVLKDSFPSIWHTKMMIKRLNAEREVVVYCDLHGHSRKHNIFIYGCENKHDRQKRLQERIFPLMLAKNASHTFSFESCKYKVQKSKEGTGRIVVWCMGVMNSYTMEATFGGTSLPGDRQNTHLSTRDLEIMGHNFCDTLLDYCDPDSSKVEACLLELRDNLKRQILRKFQLQNSDVSDVNIDDYISEMESDTSGSDSSCDDGLPVHLLAIAPKLQRKKKLKSRKDRTKPVVTKPPPNENNKQLNAQNSKVLGDKNKMRYTQGVSSARRREDRPLASTAIVTSTMADTGQNDKSPKKRVPSAVSVHSHGDSGPKQQLYPFEDPRKNGPDPLLLIAKRSFQPNSRAASATLPSAQNGMYRTAAESSRSMGGSRSTTFGEPSRFQNTNKEQNTRESKARPGSSVSLAEAHLKQSGVVPACTETSIKVDTAKQSDPKQSRTSEPVPKPSSVQPNQSPHYFTKVQDEVDEQKEVKKAQRTISPDNPVVVEQSVEKVCGDRENSQERSKYPHQTIHLETHEKDNIVSSEQDFLSDNKHTPITVSNAKDNPLPDIEASDFTSKLSNHPKLVPTRMAKLSRTRSLHQTPMTGLVKGDTMFPKNSEPNSVSSGIRKTTTLVMEPEPDKLSIQNNRSSLKASHSESSDSHGYKHANKTYQTSDDSFFGMSDRIGLGVMPRNGRVPPVVANIAELRRSLMGQGRETSEAKAESSRKIITHPHTTNRLSAEDGFQPGDGAIPFSQRPRRRNFAASKQRHKTSTEFEGRRNSTKQQSPVTDFFKEDKKSKAAEAEDDIMSSDDDCDNLSTIANLSDQKHNRRQKPGERKNDKDSFFERDNARDEPFLITSRSEPESRWFTQGNATVEKLSDYSMTNIRIGARTTKSRVDEQWIDSHQKQEGNTLLSAGRPDKQTLSAVSLNMNGRDGSDRTCVTTPALASRPAPPLLRYLSAKQGQNKKK